MPIMLTEAMVRQAEVDAAYLVVEAARADPMFQAELQEKAIEARERAHELRAAFRRSMSYQAGAVPIDIGAPEALCGTGLSPVSSHRTQPGATARGDHHGRRM